VLPIRSFLLGKARLASDLEDEARADLGRRLADRVAEAAAPFPTVVVTSAPEVRAWAAERHLPVLDDPGSLDAAAKLGYERLGASGVHRVLVDTGFRFAYGPGSFRRHAAEARRLGLGLRVVRDPDLAFDIDVPEDLAALDAPTRA